MRAAVLGSPIEHSLSPVLHNAGYAALGLDDWHYGRHELVAADLPGFLAGLDNQWRGLSLTMPLKQACLEVADEVSAVARTAGVGNTLVRRPDGWLADNTDIPGMVDALSPAWNSSWTRAAVLGAGATARSAILSLAELGVTAVDVYARDPGKAEVLVSWAPPGMAIAAHPLASWPDDDQPAVVSTLPAGVANGFVVPGGRGGLLFDVIYTDWPTSLAGQAERAGMTVVGGLDLLVRQAARQFTLFTAEPAPVAAMFAAGRRALTADGSELRKA